MPDVELELLASARITDPDKSETGPAVNMPADDPVPVSEENCEKAATAPPVVERLTNEPVMISEFARSSCGAVSEICPPEAFESPPARREAT